MKNRKRNESGFFTVWILGMCMCLFAVGGLSLDLWRGFSDRRQVASMADAAAVAAASQIDLAAFRADPSVIKLDRNAARQRATNYLRTEAAANGTKLLNVQIDVTDQAVRIEVRAELELTLSKIVAPGEVLEVAVSSAAEPRLETP